jgi:hypothetical protein
MEWEIHSMSTSEPGYRARMEAQQESIGQLQSPDAWQDGSVDCEEARDVSRVMEQLARKVKIKGKAKAC